MNRRCVCIGVLSLGAISCGAADEAAAPDTTFPAPSLERLAAIAQDLLPGSSGSDVRAVHGFLARHGYFPNRELAREYPAWRPIVAKPPDYADVFDDKTSQAVRAWQRNMRLPVTGIVDADTRAKMAVPRCGVPDGITSTDPSDKFSIGSTLVPFGSKYYIGSRPPGITTQQAAAAAAAASSNWNDATTLGLQAWNGGSAAIIIAAASPQQAPELDGHLARTYADGHIRFNTAFNWSTQTPTPAGFFDYESALIHEIGHAIGIGHSSWGGVMDTPLSDATQHRVPTTDDKVAISAKYDTWSSALGAFAEDIGGSSIEGSVWVVSASDHSIWKWMGGAIFEKDSANGDARRIAVDFDGLPWVVAPWGVYRRTSADPHTGLWEQLRTDCTTDIGIGNEPGMFTKAVWIVGCDARLYKWVNGTTSWQIDTTTGANIERVTVDSEGTPWVVASGRPFRKSTNDPTSGFWADLGGLATDIAVGSFPFAYATTKTPTTGGFTLQVFNYQEADTETPSEWKWIPLGQSGVNVAVANFGDPWVTKSGVNPNVFKTVR